MTTGKTTGKIHMPLAYCVEFRRVVSIHLMRREFLSSETPLEFSFLCADEACRTQGVRVVGVNYKTCAREEAKFKAAHFRRHKDYEHVAGCVFFAGETDGVSRSRGLHGESPEEEHDRKLLRRLTGFVSEFDPRMDEELSEATEGEKIFRPGGNNLGSPTAQGGSIRSTNPRGGRTNDLDRLVETYLEAKETLSQEELNAYHLNIIGVGRIPIKEYFRHLEFASLNTRDRVIYGGVKRFQRYGLGFKFWFYDKIEGLPVCLYVPSEKMKAYRFRKFVESILAQWEQVAYFKIYALGKLQRDSKGSAIDLIVGSMRQLSIIPGPKRIPAQSG